ncbi:hypothetical protein HPB48_019279 [Haemaphysalis longicornis]|uniref:Homeobox domain-containing protein n=1 Tax=Haemaphysalis longicornis TaxID=44386 RepID=A0A9J6F6P8_HAELO|nr:hypothetical protein HPB48_019279 [Haemaphysalis longicornis]
MVDRSEFAEYEKEEADDWVTTTQLSRCFICDVLMFQLHFAHTVVILLPCSHSQLSRPVKVWFQNRRTKHKRQKQEEEHTTSHGGSDCKASSSPSRPPVALSPDIQMDDSSSDSTQPDPLS